MATIQQTWTVGKSCCVKQLLKLDNKIASNYMCLPEWLEIVLVLAPIALTQPGWNAFVQAHHSASVLNLYLSSLLFDDEIAWRIEYFYLGARWITLLTAVCRKSVGPSHRVAHR